MQAAGLQTSIWNNNIRSFLLLALYPFMIGFMVWVIAGLGASAYGYGYYVPIDWAHFSRAGNAAIRAWWPDILIAIAVWFTVSFFFHDRMISALSHSRPVARTEEPRLYNLLENLCIARGLPMPALNIIETDALNAFASGITAKDSSITVTRGLMRTLNDEEMESVLAHELTHIINHDVRLLVISIIFTGMVGFAAQMVWRSARISLYGMGPRDRRGDVRIAAIMMVVALVLYVGYLATMFTRFALSRRREYMADAGSVEITHRPESMMKALQRIAGHDHMPHATADVALMCIENSQPFLGLFSTHPPIEARIEAIAALTRTAIPQEAPAPAPTAPNPRNPWLPH
jgi:heat shock protein HtpX